MKKAIYSVVVRAWSKTDKGESYVDEFNVLATNAESAAAKAKTNMMMRYGTFTEKGYVTKHDEIHHVCRVDVV